MMKNLKIETNLSYDYDTNFDFEESFINIDGRYYLYIDYGNFTSEYSAINHYKISDTKKNKTLMRYFIVNDFDEIYSNIKKLDFDELSLLFLECITLYGVDFFKDIRSLLFSYNIEFTSNYFCLDIRGNSQGDYNYLLINKEEFFSNFNPDFKVNDLKENFTNIFYNPQIVGDINISFTYEHISFFEGCRFSIDKDISIDFDYNEFCNNSYEIDLTIESIIRVLQDSCQKSLTSEDIILITEELNNIDYTCIK